LRARDTVRLSTCSYSVAPKKTDNAKSGSARPKHSDMLVTPMTSRHYRGTSASRNDHLRSWLGRSGPRIIHAFMLALFRIAIGPASKDQQIFNVWNRTSAMHGCAQNFGGRRRRGHDLVSKWDAIKRDPSETNGTMGRGPDETVRARAALDHPA
jgi:hypothetical protein